jgi:anti-sigma B factor antagonist
MTKIFSKDINNIIIFEIQGEFHRDDKSIELKNRIEELIAKGKTKFIINLKEVTSISSSGLSVLIGLLPLFSTSNSSLVLSQLSEPVQKILEAANLKSIFNIQDGAKEVVRTAAN